MAQEKTAGTARAALKGALIGGLGSGIYTGSQRAVEAKRDKKRRFAAGFLEGLPRGAMVGGAAGAGIHGARKGKEFIVANADEIRGAARTFKRTLNRVGDDFHGMRGDVGRVADKVDNARIPNPFKAVMKALKGDKRNLREQLKHQRALRKKAEFILTTYFDELEKLANAVMGYGPGRPGMAGRPGMKPGMRPGGAHVPAPGVAKVAAEGEGLAHNVGRKALVGGGALYNMVGNANLVMGAYQHGSAGSAQAKRKAVRRMVRGGLQSAGGIGGVIAGGRMKRRAERQAKVKALEKKGMPFLEQDRPAKVKEIYRALKRDHPDMAAEKKARIAIRRGRATPQARKSLKDGGPPYKADI